MGRKLRNGTNCKNTLRAGGVRVSNATFWFVVPVTVLRLLTRFQAVFETFQKIKNLY